MIKRSLFPLLVMASASVFSGCNAPAPGAAPSASNGASLPLGNPAGAGNSNNAQPANAVPVGEPCVSSDPNKICLAMHFVTYKDSSGKPVANTTQAATIIHTMNQLWNQCTIGFEIEKYEAVDPTQYSLAYGAESQNQLDQIRKTFDAPADELLGVTTGPWGTTVNAWTNMPGDGIYGSIMEASIVDYGGGIIYAHEFGHYLGLDHVSDTSNLMNPVIYTTSTTINSSQCQTARSTANSYWGAMYRK